MHWRQSVPLNRENLPESTMLVQFCPRRRPQAANVMRAREAGLEFIDSEGIKRRLDNVLIYQGADSCEVFFDDMLQTIRKRGGEIISVFKSQEVMARLCGLAGRGAFERLGQLDIPTIKCLSPEAPAPSFFTSFMQFRAISRHHIGPVSYYVYGDKHAIVLAEEGMTIRFVVFKSTCLAQSYRDHFYSLWENGLPL